MEPKVLAIILHLLMSFGLTEAGVPDFVFSV